MAGAAADAPLLPDRRFGDDPLAGRNAVLAVALEDAVQELRQRAGPDVEAWVYGQPALKHITIEHPLAPLLPDSLARRLNHGPSPRGGYGHTPNATGMGWSQSSGASFRLITDVGDWDRSLGTHTPGQSGDPRSAHYGDLFAPWARGEYFPVAFSRERVEAVTTTRTRLLQGANEGG